MGGGTTPGWGRVPPYLTTLPNGASAWLAPETYNLVIYVPHKMRLAVFSSYSAGHIVPGNIFTKKLWPNYIQRKRTNAGTLRFVSKLLLLQDDVFFQIKGLR